MRIYSIDEARKTTGRRGGTVKLDQSRWKRGILKASFDLTVANTSEPGRPMFWRGEILP